MLQQQQHELHIDHIDSLARLTPTQHDTGLDRSFIQCGFSE